MTLILAILGIIGLFLVIIGGIWLLEKPKAVKKIGKRRLFRMWSKESGCK